jgi:hypothetical protein
MSLADWTIYKSDPFVTVRINTTNPIGGGGSLVLADNGITNPQAVLVRTSSREKGYLAGTLRTLIRIDDLDGAGVGMVFMMNKESIAKISGEFYGVFLGETQNVGVSELVLARFTEGMQNSPDMYIFSEEIEPVGVLALEVGWESSFGTLGGTRIIIRRSNPLTDANSFASLLTVYDDIDTSDALLVTKAEGFAYHNAFDGTNKFILDNSRMTDGV